MTVSASIVTTTSPVDAATPALRVAVALVSTIAIFGTYRTLNGIEAGTAFLVLMAAAKLLETRTARDLTVIVFIAWFLLYAAVLREQGLLQLPWLLASAFLTAVALMRVHAPSAQAPAREILRRTLKCAQMFLNGHMTGPAFHLAPFLVVVPFVIQDKIFPISCQYDLKHTFAIFAFLKVQK